jgi:hypothetical protein
MAAALRTPLAATFLTLSVTLPGTAAAQSTVTISGDDPVYRDLDILIDRGLITNVIVGQRPYSRRLIARLAREARDGLDNGATGGYGSTDPRRVILSRVLSRVRDEVAMQDSAVVPTGARVTLFEHARVEALGTDAQSRPVPDNGLGSTEADTRPLTAYRGGRPYAAGGNLGIETAHQLQLRAFSIQLQPLVLLQSGRDGVSGGVAGHLVTAHARALLGNTALTVGREYTSWAQAERTGLMFSDNAPALNLVRAASDVPFVLPGALRRIGPMAATIQAAGLGPSVANSHSLLVSYKVSARPTPALELGASFENHFGGAGTPSPSLKDRFIDLVPLLDIFRHHVDSTDVVSDKLLGADGRLRLSQLGDVTLFGELALEDFDFHRLRSIFTEDAAYTAGIIAPSLFRDALSARVAYHVTGLRFYAHHQITNGITSRRIILGDDLGHDGAGVSGTLRWERSDGSSITFDAARETRSNDQYVGTYLSPGRTGLVFQRVATLPREQRTRGTATARWFALAERAMVEVSGGLERTKNFGFVANPSRLNVVGSVSVSAYR